jgi:thiol-disulfide isomerase/thioredoxin
MIKQATLLRRTTTALLLLAGLLGMVPQSMAGDAAQMEGRLISGEKFNLTQWRGQVVMVNFWATWCGVCKSEMPDWQALYERHRGKGFQMIAVSVDDDEPEVREFVTRNKRYTYPVAWRFDKSEDDNFPTIRATPTTMFIGKDGQVALVKAGAITADELERIVKSLL